jgi:hypothetical protein
MKRFLNWLADKISPQEASPQPDLKQTGRHTIPRKSPKKTPIKQAVPRSQPEFVEFDARVDGKIDNAGPGKSVFKRNKYIREETGTHETLSILDESAENTPDEEGIDPYNTGQFDRSKTWDKRFRKD